MALSRVIKWDAAETEMFDKTLSPEEIMDKLEERVGPEGRKLFERFLRDVNELGHSGTWRRRRRLVSPNAQASGGHETRGSLFSAVCSTFTDPVRLPRHATRPQFLCLEAPSGASS